MAYSRSSLYIWFALTSILASSAYSTRTHSAFVIGTTRFLPQIHRFCRRKPLQTNRPSYQHLASSLQDDVNQNGPQQSSSHARQSIPPEYNLREIPGKGTGVITTIPIPQNTAVGDYTGEMLTQDEKDQRYLPSLEPMRTQVDLAWIQSRIDRAQTVTGDYVYAVTVPDGKPPIYIDSEDEDVGGWTRFVNHSSDPEGCNLVPKSVHESWDGMPRVWFVAKRDIEAGEELCFDYGDGYWLEGDVVA